MKIALDVSSAARPQLTGVAMYIRRLTAAFARVNAGLDGAQQHRFTLVTRASRPKNIFHRMPLPDGTGRGFKHKLMIEGLHPVFARSIDIFHGLDARLPGAWMKAPMVVTIHDVFSALQSTEFATADFRAMKAKRYDELLRRADRIVCVSNSVKRDVLETLKPDPAKLRVVYEAGGDAFYPRDPEAVAAVRKKYALDRPYFIFVGSINRRKNVPAMVRAFLKARAAAKSDMSFAIAGRVGYGGDEIQAAIGEAGAAGAAAIKLLGYVPDEDVPLLYCGARALLFATLYEGFGIPAVEAFACGCPVIGANVGSLPEIVADAGLLADPSSEDSIAEKIAALMSDDSLRDKCARKGLERAKLFSWDKAARECLDIYRELLPM